MLNPLEASTPDNHETREDLMLTYACLSGYRLSLLENPPRVFDRLRRKAWLKDLDNVSLTCRRLACAFAGDQDAYEILQEQYQPHGGLHGKGSFIDEMVAVAEECGVDPSFRVRFQQRG